MASAPESAVVAPAAGRVHRWLRRPLLRLPVKALLVLAPGLLGPALAGGVLHWRGPLIVWVAVPVSTAVAVALFVLYTRRIEQRSVAELGLHRAVGEVWRGLLLGMLCMSAVIGVLAALGHYHVTGVAAWSVLLLPFFDGLETGLFEELLFRGVLFRIVQESLGSYWALGISSAFFGAAHLFNPNATWFGAVSIMMEAGVLLGAAYMLTQRLWLPIGLHAGWNFTEGGLFGTAVSGTEPHGLLHASLSGPAWLAGGAFGPEASLIAIGISGAAGIVLLRYARAKGRVAPPSWRRQRILAGNG